MRRDLLLRRPDVSILFAAAGYLVVKFVREARSNRTQRGGVIRHSQGDILVCIAGPKLQGRVTELAIIYFPTAAASGRGYSAIVQLEAAGG